tara:strand:+ start:641 stop:889 length:249 start_codon:yes stop_codon:yes gene_type:complete
MIEKNLKDQIMNKVIDAPRKRLERQENQLMSELNCIEIEICKHLETLISVNWESPSLQAVIMLKISQRKKMWNELDKIWGFN